MVFKNLFIFLFLTSFFISAFGMEHPEHFKRKEPETPFELPEPKAQKEEMLFTVVTSDKETYTVPRSALELSGFFKNLFATAERGLGAQIIQTKNISVDAPSSLVAPIVYLLLHLNYGTMTLQEIPDYIEQNISADNLTDLFQLSYQWEINPITSALGKFIINNVDSRDINSISALLTYPAEQLAFITSHLDLTVENAPILFTLFYHTGNLLSEEIYKKYGKFIAENALTIKNNNRLMQLFAPGEISDKLKKYVSLHPVKKINFGSDKVTHLHLTNDNKKLFFTSNGFFKKYISFVDLTANNVKLVSTLTSMPSLISYTKDGKLIAAVIDGDSYIINPETKNLTPLSLLSARFTWNNIHRLLAVAHPLTLTRLCIVKPITDTPYNISLQHTVNLGTNVLTNKIDVAWNYSGHHLLVMLNDNQLKIYRTSDIINKMGNCDPVISKNIWSEILKEEQQNRKVYKIYGDSNGNIIFTFGDHINEEIIIWNMQSDKVTKIQKRNEFTKSINLIQNNILVIYDAGDGLVSDYAQLINTQDQKVIWELEIPTTSLQSAFVSEENVFANDDYLLIERYHGEIAARQYFVEFYAINQTLSLPELIELFQVPISNLLF